MKRQFILRQGICCGLLTLLFAVTVLGQEQNHYALGERTLEDFQNLSSDNLPLTDWLIRISDEAARDLLGAPLDGEDVRKFLDQTAAKIFAELEGAADPASVIRALNYAVFQEEKFRVDRSQLFQAKLEYLLFPLTVKNRKGYCLSLSLLYLSLAEQMGLPLHGVMVPGHFFVRYDSGGQERNIETTFRGREYPDGYYKKRFMRDFDDGVSLRLLTDKEVIAVYLANVATHYKLQGHHAQAINIFQAVIQAVPERACFYVNLGNAYERSGNIIKAVISYQKALALNPYLCEAHYNLGLIHFLYTKMHDQAKRHGMIARALGCRMHPEFKKFLNFAP